MTSPFSVAPVKRATEVFGLGFSPLDVLLYLLCMVKFNATDTHYAKRTPKCLYENFKALHPFSQEASSFTRGLDTKNGSFSKLCEIMYAV